MDKIRILHILSDTNVGGAGRLLYNLAESIDKSRFEFIYVFPKGSKLVDLFKRSMIYTVSNGADRSLDLSAAREVKTIINITQPHIIHTHSSLFARVGAKLAGFDKNRIVYTKHCVFDLPGWTKLKPLRFLYGRLDDHLSGNIIAVAESAREELYAYGVSKDKINVIINGVPPQKISSKEENQALKEALGIDEKAFIVGISARLESYKGHKTLIEAASIIKKKGIDDIAFLIIGCGSYADKLENYTEALGVTDRVLFLGFQKNVAEYVNLFDVNVNCSTGTETSSLAISEGLSLGKPIIATDFGGNPNMVKVGKTGYLFECNNADELAKRILHLKNTPATLKYMSKNAILDFKERFSADVMARQYENFYESIYNIK